MGPLKTPARLALIVAVVLVQGCVYEDQCVDGFTRGADGRCSSGTTDSGTTDTGTDGDTSTPDVGPDADAGGDIGPPDTGTPPAIADFSLGSGIACAVDTDGRLLCWGANLLGGLATGDISPQDEPVVIDLGAPVTYITADQAVCASTTAPSLHCWGNNESAMVGDGTTTFPVTAPFEHVGRGTVRALATAFATTCVVSLLGSAECWGRNDSGQLGIGTVSMRELGPTDPPSPVLRMPADSLEAVERVVVGDRHNCFQVVDEMRAYCVGANGEGQLGIGSRVDSSYAVQVAGIDMVTSIDAAGEHTCAVSRSAVYCWGENDSGQVQPTAAETFFDTPQAVMGVGAATAVVTGEKFSCALLSTGEVTCWGSREHGSLGDGVDAGPGVSPPVMVSGLSNVEKIDASYLNQACALTRDAELYCWGEDAITLLGGGMVMGVTTYLDDSTIHTSPVRVDPL